MEGTIGEIRMFGGNFAPSGWVFCQGQTLPISTYDAAYTILGTIYGGDGMQTFGVPNLSGRVPVGTGTVPGLTTIALGQSGGSETVTLTNANLATHTHAATFNGQPGTPATLTGIIKVSANAGTSAVAGAGGANTLGESNAQDSSRASLLCKSFVRDNAPTLPLTGFTVTQSSAGGGTVTNTNAGSSIPLPIMEPFLVTNYIICLLGIYPTRP